MDKIFNGKNSEKLSPPPPQRIQTKPLTVLSPTLSSPSDYKFKPPIQSFQSKPQPQSFQSKPQQQIFQSKPPSKTFQTKPPTQSFQSKPLPQTFQSKPPTQSFQSKPPTQTFQSKPPLKSFQSKPPTQSFQSKPPTQNFQAKPLPQSFQAKPQTQSFQAEPQPQSFQAKAPPPLTPTYSSSPDYKFKPHPIQLISPQTVDPAGTDFPRARSFSVFQHEESGQATKKRDLKYQDYYDYISSNPGPPPPPYQRFERAEENEEYREPPVREREKHFAGFENDSLLSQVGKSVNLRVSKSIRPGSNYGPKPGSYPGSSIPNINEPLFYPEKPLKAPLKAKAHDHERDFLMNQGMADIQLTPSGPGGVPRLTPGPGSIPRVTPTPHHAFQETQPYHPSPLPALRRSQKVRRRERRGEDSSSPPILDTKYRHCLVLITDHCITIQYSSRLLLILLSHRHHPAPP